ncbi:MAG: TPM domain-containing protein [Deltaproteobacteria bacterium]|nr:TPM domain-containing protein [Deltaproteobacteria bacterium]
MFQSRRYLSALLCILLVLSITTSPEAVERFPKPAGAVNDFARVISPDDKARMEELSREVLEKTRTSIVIATVQTIGDNDVNDYVNRLYQTWGIGRKGEDKGVLIFLTLRERKVRIETGYGVEGILPDGLVGEILDKYAIPHFRQGNYGKGLMNAAHAVASVVARDANVQLTGSIPVEREKVKKTGQGVNLLYLIVLFLVLILLLGARQGREILPWLFLIDLSRSGRSGGFGGFGGGGFGGFGGGLSGGGGASRGF